MVMSDEHKAKMKAARDAKIAKAKAEKVAHLAEVTAQVTTDLTPNATPDEIKAKVGEILADEQLDTDLLSTLNKYNTLVVKKASKGKGTEAKEDPRIAKALKALS